MGKGHVARLIEEARDAKTLCGAGVSEDDIALAEKELGLLLPLSYRTFLRECGWVSVKGLIVWGLPSEEERICYNAQSIVDIVARARREYGLPAHLVWISSDGSDFQFMLDTSVMVDQEVPVVNWPLGLSADDMAARDGAEIMAPSFALWFQKELAVRLDVEQQRKAGPSRTSQHLDARKPGCLDMLRRCVRRGQPK